MIKIRELLKRYFKIFIITFLVTIIISLIFCIIMNVSLWMYFAIPIIFSIICGLIAITIYEISRRWKEPKH